MTSATRPKTLSMPSQFDEQKRYHKDRVWYLLCLSNCDGILLAIQGDGESFLFICRLSSYWSSSFLDCSPYSVPILTRWGKISVYTGTCNSSTQTSPFTRTDCDGLCCVTVVTQVFEPLLTTEGTQWDPLLCPLKVHKWSRINGPPSIHTECYGRTYSVWWICDGFPLHRLTTSNTVLSLLFWGLSLTNRRPLKHVSECAYSWRYGWYPWCGLECDGDISLCLSVYG